jgi:hypothetical protein
MTPDDGRSILNSEFLPVLRANRLDRRDRVMAYQGGESVRSARRRSTVRPDLATAGGSKSGGRER